LQVRTRDGLEEMHLGMRSGQSYALTTLNLEPNVSNPVRVSLVYPADATPGHLLSVVPSSQLAMVQARQAQQPQGSAAAAPAPAPRPVAQPAPRPAPRPVTAAPPAAPAVPPRRPAVSPPANLPRSIPAVRSPAGPSGLLERYQEAMEAQQEVMRGLLGY
jgi:hypothetical protein